MQYLKPYPTLAVGFVLGALFGAKALRLIKK